MSEYHLSFSVGISVLNVPESLTAVGHVLWNCLGKWTPTELEFLKNLFVEYCWTILTLTKVQEDLEFYSG